MKKLCAILFIITLTLYLSATAFAVDFVPSVERKLAPEIILDTSGNAAVITDDTGSTTPVSSGYIIVTPLSQADQAQDTEMAKTLKAAYTELAEAASLKEVCHNFADVLTVIDSSLEDQDMVVKDVFDISAYGDAKQQLQDGGSIRITLDTNLNEDTPRILLNYKSSAWTSLAPEQVKSDTGGSTTITVNSLGPFAIVVPGNSIPDPGETSPQTSDDSAGFWLAVAAASAILATVFIAVAVRNKPARHKDR